MGNNGRAKSSKRRRERRNNLKLENLNDSLCDVQNVEHKGSRGKRCETDRGKAMVAALCLMKGLSLVRRVVKYILEKIIKSWEVTYGLLFRSMGPKRPRMFQILQGSGVMQMLQHQLADRLVGLLIHTPMKLTRLWHSKSTRRDDDRHTDGWKKGLVLPLPHGRLMLDVSMKWMSRTKIESKKALGVARDLVEEDDQSIRDIDGGCGRQERSEEGAFEALGQYSKIATSPGPESKKAVAKSNVEDRILAVR